MVDTKETSEKELRVVRIRVPFGDVLNLAAQLFFAWLLIGGLVGALGYAIWKATETSRLEARELKAAREAIERLR